MHPSSPGLRSGQTLNPTARNQISKDDRLADKVVGRFPSSSRHSLARSELSNTRLYHHLRPSNLHVLKQPLLAHPCGALQCNVGAGVS